MSSEKDLHELKELIDSRPKSFEKATQGVKQALETVTLNNQWKIGTYVDLSRRLNKMLLRNFDYNDIDEDSEDETKSIWYIIFEAEDEWRLLIEGIIKGVSDQLNLHTYLNGGIIM